MWLMVAVTLTLGTQVFPDGHAELVPVEQTFDVVQNFQSEEACRSRAELVNWVTPDAKLEDGNRSIGYRCFSADDPRLPGLLTPQAGGL